jgi:hypothetical protein
MSTTSVYCFVEADSKEAALKRARYFGQDSLGKEFYNGFEIREDDVLPFSELSAYFLVKGKVQNEQFLLRLRGDLEYAQERGTRLHEGLVMLEIGRLLVEDLSSDMPWYNFERADYSLPADAEGWWAVKVDFHY